MDYPLMYFDKVGVKMSEGGVFYKIIFGGD